MEGEREKLRWSDIVECGDHSHVKRRKVPVHVPWQIGGGGDTDTWEPPRCGPSDEEKAKHKYYGLLRSQQEAKKTKIAEGIFKTRKRRQQIVTFPSETNLQPNIVEPPFAIMESDLVQSYYCRPPKISASLMEILDKYYPPLIDREFHPSFLDLPLVKGPPTVQLTDTARSLMQTRRDKRLARQKLKAKQETLKTIRTRIKGLKRLRDGYVNTENRYKCHYAERKLAKLKEKKEYIQNLANKYYCNPKLLELRTDSLYEKYLENEKEKRRKERQYVKLTLEWMERLLQEERKIEKLEHPKPFVVKLRPKPQVVQLVQEPVILEGIKEDPVIEGEGMKTMGIEKRVGQVDDSKDKPQESKDKDDSKRRSSKRASKASGGKRGSRASKGSGGKRASRGSKVGRRASKRASKSGSRRASKRASKVGRRASKESTGGGRPSSVKKPRKSEPVPLEPYVEEPPTSVLDPDLVDMFKKWNKKWLEVEGMKPVEKGLPPVDTMYTLKPAKILINNFQPNVVYTRRVKLINRGRKRAQCRPYMITMQPDDDFGVLKVEPWKVLNSPPGIYPVVKLIFSPVATTGRIEADVIFLSRCPPKSWKMFSFHVTCIPPSPQISVNPVVFNFPPKKIWSQEILTEHFIIKNLGAVPCTMFIRRVDGFHPTCTDCEEMSIYEDDFEDSNHITVDSMFSIFPSIKFLGLKDKAKEPTKKRRFIKMVDIDDIANESQDIAEMIVHSLFKRVFESFTMNRKYEVEVPGRSRVRVSLAFKPRFSPHVGLVHEQWCLMFTDFSEFCRTQVINMFGKIETTPLYIKPLVLDMSLCLLDNGVQQQTFVVGNRGKRCHQLVIKLPPSMASQAMIHNPCPLILGGEQVKILVRLDLKYSFCAEASEFYDPSTHILDFPVYVSSKDEEETGPPLQVRVMAIVSRSMGLQLSPSLINYGVVYTYQSAVVTFYLANHTLASHKFAFLNLPKFVMIQPGHGFGVIRGGERLKLDLVYSPSSEQVAWPGGAAEHFFILAVTTMDRLANHQPIHKLVTMDHKHKQLFPQEYEVKDEDYPPLVDEAPKERAASVTKTEKKAGKKSMVAKKSIAGGKGTSAAAAPKKPQKAVRSSTSGTETKDEITEVTEPQNVDPLDFNFVMPDFDELLELYKRKSIFGDDLLPYGVEEKSKSKKKSRQMSAIKFIEGGDVDPMMEGNIMAQNRMIAEGAFNPAEDDVHILPICKTPDPLFSYLVVRAVVVDPHCELSAQRIVLPPTPYYSYTITPFHLKCPNMQSYRICYCSKEFNYGHKEPPKVKGRFEFFSNLKFLDIEPSSGQIFTGQDLKINVIVRPRLSPTEILERAKVIKAIAERERLLKEREKKKKGLKKSSKSTRRSSRRQSSRRGSKRASKAPSQKERKSKAGGGGARKSMKRKSTGGKKRQSTGGKKRQSAVGGGKRASKAGGKGDGGKRTSTASGKRKSMTGKSRGSKKSNAAHADDVEEDIVVNPQDMVPDEVDLFNAKLDLMRYKEPVNFATKVVCHIETELQEPPFTKRKEELELFLYGTLVRPDFVVFTPPNLDQHIKFETTAVGLKRQLFFEVYNTSGRTILLNHSFFDSPETYFIPVRLPLDQHKPNHFLHTGMWLEPDHHIKFPITFAPKKEKTTSEFIEIRANKTIVPIKIQGRGIEPKFKITPEFILGKLRSHMGSPGRLTFIIENLCDADLEFDFLKLYTKEGPIYPLDPRQSKPSLGKLKKSGRKSLSRKSVSRKSTTGRKSAAGGARKSAAGGARKSAAGGARKSAAGGARKSAAGGARKSAAGGARKSAAGARKSMTGGGKKGKAKHDEEDVHVDKAEIKDSGRKNIADASRKKSAPVFQMKNYDEKLKGDLISSLKQNFTPVDAEKQNYMYTIPTKTVLKPHTQKRFEVVFKPFKLKSPEMEEDEKRERRGSKKSRKSMSRKSLARKSSVKRKSQAGGKKKSIAGGSRKSVARKSKAGGSRKSVARKSVARKSKVGGAKKSIAGGPRKSKTGGGKSPRASKVSPHELIRPPKKAVEYIIEEESFKKTFCSKVRLMLGNGTKILDWWFLGQVFEVKEQPASQKKKK